MTQEHAGPADPLSALAGVGYPQRDLGLVRTRLDQIQLRSFDTGRVVIWEANKPGDAYIVHKGSLEVVRHDPGGHEKRAFTVGPGGIVGVTGFLTPEIPSVQVKAGPWTELYVIPSSLFDYMLSASPDFKATMQALADRRRDILSAL